MARTVDDRLSKRLDLLARLQYGTGREGSADAVARAVRQRLWAQRPQSAPPVVRLRARLVLRGDREISPLRELATSKGVAVQMLLVALFVEQCRKPTNTIGTPTPIPLAYPVVAGDPCWRHLIALPTERRPGRRTGTSRGLANSQLDQLRAALDRLHDFGKVDLKESRPRYEEFTVRDESVLRGAPIQPYKVPAPARELVIDVPPEFFTCGWVHALGPDETVAYLFLLYRNQLSQESNDDGLSVNDDLWGLAFERPRAQREAYRRLHRMGLISADRSDLRNQDGTMPDGADNTLGVRPVNEMTFRVDLERLTDDGVSAAIDALRRQLDGEGLDDASLASWTERHGGV
ncbi:hypothetical protein [Pseudonocardia alni]|uniref:hypothetical protein n=1 Tax=Pseudonocardia alni TaxID=33907 RepID=UPI00340E896F